MARDFLLQFTSFAGGATVSAAVTSAALQIDPYNLSGRRALLVRFNVGQTAVATGTAVRWNFAVQVSKDGTTWTTTSTTPTDAAALACTVTGGVPADASIQYYLEVLSPNLYVDASGVTQDNYNRIRVIATPTLTGGGSVNCTLSAAIVSGKDGAYS